MLLTNLFLCFNTACLRENRRTILFDVPVSLVVQLYLLLSFHTISYILCPTVCFSNRHYSFNLSSVLLTKIFASRSSMPASSVSVLLSTLWSNVHLGIVCFLWCIASTHKGCFRDETRRALQYITVLPVFLESIKWQNS